MVKLKNIITIFLILVTPFILFAQNGTGDAEEQELLNIASPEKQEQQVNEQKSESESKTEFEEASKSVQRKLEKSVAELNRLREKVAAEKVPLSKKLNELEAELIAIRDEYQETSRLLDTRTLDLSNLRSEIKKRKEEATYLSNLLSEYMRNFESRLHISEIDRYSDPLEKAKLATENSNLSQREVFEAQAELLEVSLSRLEDNLGGTSFEGTAVNPIGLVKEGKFVLMGPTAIFRSDDGKNVGTIEQQLGSLKPAIIPFANPADANAAENLIAINEGQIPLDPSLGNAHKIEETKETLLGHIKKGGPVMYPIFTLAGAALLVALFKWIHMLFVKTPSQKKIDGLLNAVAEHDENKVKEKVDRIKGPVGQMLQKGVEHIKEPRDLIEEVMFEKVMSTRLKLERFLPFIAITAASAPLLGLLGTVTGIINTFKLITVFGSGDVKTLSGGISEALITTEFGLIVAIPSLLLHAFLSRKARTVVNKMEKAAVSFVNQVGKTPYREEESNNSFAKLTPQQVQQLLQVTDKQKQPESETTEEEAQSRYSEDSAGSLMNPQVISVAKNCTVAEAIKKIRSVDIDDDIDSIFVVDENGKYMGHVKIRQLLIKPEYTLVETLIDKTPLFTRVDTHRDEVHSLLDQHDLISMPVLDHDDQLLGRISRSGNGEGNGDINI